jgi:hypothetical protein
MKCSTTYPVLDPSPSSSSSSSGSLPEVKRLLVESADCSCATLSRLDGSAGAFSPTSSTRRLLLDGRSFESLRVRDVVREIGVRLSLDDCRLARECAEAFCCLSAALRSMAQERAEELRS